MPRHVYYIGFRQKSKNIGHVGFGVLRGTPCACSLRDSKRNHDWPVPPRWFSNGQFYHVGMHSYRG